jgi:hypothetical protein
VATLIPSVPKDCTRSERIVFERLGRELDPSWIILHSLGLKDHERKLRGETDAVVLSTRGIFALEVKGGRVSCRDGIWYFGSPGGREYSRQEDPWTQASGGMFAIRKRITEIAPELSNLLFGFGVVMPMERFSADGEEIDREVLLDRADFDRNFGFYIGNLERRWKKVYFERHGREPQQPTVEVIKRIRQILRPDVESCFSLGSWLNGLEQELIQLTNEQIRISRRLASNPRMIVSGRAGTGKTLLAVERALGIAEKGKSVLLLCFNQLLSNHIAENIANREHSARITVRHIHGFYHDIIAKAGLLEKLKIHHEGENDFFGVHFPKIYADAVMEIEPALFDAIIVDEAQDILTPYHLDAIDLTIDGGLEQGSWHLFLDPLQNVYGGLSGEAESRLDKLSFTRDQLTDNCRNTRDVAVQASILSMMDLPISGAPKGPPCKVIYYDRSADCVELLTEEVAKMLQQDVRVSDMVILSTRTIQNSLISSNSKIAGLDIRSVADGPRSGTLAFSTIHAFKGLERSVVFVIDLAEIGNDEWSMIHYAGLSRARHVLVPFVPRSMKKRYDELVGAYGSRVGRQ